ncbi:MAG: oxidoreductase domain protein [Capsulimonas sp.]|nr:oxidoreductase domain protein [Capsulimonas sp.]
MAMNDQWRGEMSRRGFVTMAGQGIMAASLLGESIRAVNAQAVGGAASGDVALSRKPIALPPLEAKTERDPGPAPLSYPPDKRVGFAVVGLGNLALQQIIPAFGESKYARLTAVVSGSPDKAREVAGQHGVPERGIYSYENYDTIRDNPDVQVIYIVLPNSMHMEYTVRGAEAGKHILCEKPMATSPDECEKMIAACKKANRKLMIAYRIQYEPNNRYIRELIRSQKYGAVKLIEGVNGQAQGDPSQWRLKKALAGGGSLPDVGLYCLNTTRFLTGEEPVEVFGTIFNTPGDPRFREVEDNVTFQMRFPTGVLSNNATSYSFHEGRRYRVYAERAWYGLDPAFSYEGLRPELSYAEDDKEFRQTPQVGQKNQFALELDHMAQCVINDHTPFTPGEEGLQDHRIMAAIYESARTGKPVQLPVQTKRDAFRGPEPMDAK